MTTTTIPGRRVGTVRYLLADLANGVFGPDHKGADERWFSELRKAGAASRAAVPWPDATPTVVLPVVRPSLAAIAPVPHREVVDEHLGVLRIASLEPARLFDTHRYNALIGGMDA